MHGERSNGNMLPGWQAAAQLPTNHGWHLGRVKVRPKPPQETMSLGRAEGNCSAARRPLLRGWRRVPAPAAASLGEPSARSHPAARSQAPGARDCRGGVGARPDAPLVSERHGQVVLRGGCGAARGPARLLPAIGGLAGLHCRGQRPTRTQPRPDSPVWDAGLIRKGRKLSPEAKFILRPSTQGHQRHPLVSRRGILGSRRGTEKKKAFMTAGNALPAKRAQLVTDPRHPIPPQHEAADDDGVQDHAPLLRLVPPPAQRHSPCPALRNGGCRWHDAPPDCRTLAPTSHVGPLPGACSGGQASQCPMCSATSRRSPQSTGQAASLNREIPHKVYHLVFQSRSVIISDQKKQ